MSDQLAQTQSSTEGFVILTLRIYYQTIFGDAVYLVGSPEWLSGWDTRYAFQMKMFKISQNQFRWEISFSISRQDISTFYYKYFIGSYDHKEVHHWEQSEDRCIQTNLLRDHIIITDTWNDPSTRKIIYRDLEEVCGICMDPLEKHSLALNSVCYHTFCQTCLHSYNYYNQDHRRFRECSICRATLEFGKIITT